MCETKFNIEVSKMIYNNVNDYFRFFFLVGWCVCVCVVGMVAVFVNVLIFASFFIIISHFSRA